MKNEKLECFEKFNIIDIWKYENDLFMKMDEIVFK